VARGIVSALHRPITVTDPVATDQSLEIGDTIQTDAVIDSGTAVDRCSMSGARSSASPWRRRGRVADLAGHADIQDDVQQILSSGQLVVASLGATSSVLTEQAAALPRVVRG